MCSFPLGGIFLVFGFIGAHIYTRVSQLRVPIGSNRGSRVTSLCSKMTRAYGKNLVEKYRETKIQLQKTEKNPNIELTVIKIYSLDISIF